MEVAAEMQNLLLAPLAALISHGAKRQNGVCDSVSGFVNRSGARSDHTRGRTEQSGETEGGACEEQKGAHKYGGSSTERAGGSAVKDAVKPLSGCGAPGSARRAAPGSLFMN